MRANMLERMQSLYVEQQKNLELDLGTQLAWQREAVGEQPAELELLEGELRLAEAAGMRARQQSILTSPNPGPNPNPNATQGSNPGLADPRQVCFSHV